MQLGQYQIQVFVSVALILGAALIALICDYLKGHNEKLRELAVELKTRNEESAKVVQMLAGPLRSEHPPLQSPPIDPPENFLFPFSHATEPELAHDLSRAQAPAPDVRDSPCPAAGLPAPRERMSPETMIAIVRSAIKTPSQRQSQPPAPPAATPVVLLAKQQDSVKKDWNALLAAHPKQIAKPRNAAPQAPRAETSGLPDALAAAAAGPESAPPALPSGLQNALVWKRLLASGRTISGLIVSISVTSSTQAETALDFPAAVRSGIVSLLEPGEFAAPSGTGEFVLISPRSRGAAALRRLSRLSQHLWDVQLGSLGKFDLQYVWDGLEVRDEPVPDALEAAYERMQQTRRSRHLVALAARRESSFSWREAV